MHAARHDPPAAPAVAVAPAPSLADALRLAALAARLPQSDPRSPARVCFLAELAADDRLGDAALTSAVLRTTDWFAVFVYLGKARGLGGTAIKAMAVAELVALLEEVTVGPAGQRPSPEAALRADGCEDRTLRPRVPGAPAAAAQVLHCGRAETRQCGPAGADGPSISIRFQATQKVGE